MKLVGITGGIGSGKSYVCDILRQWGYEVYDCDSRAHGLIEADAMMRRRINREVLGIESDVYDRAAIGGAVFADPSKLRVLNAIVHGEVRADLLRWGDDLSRRGVQVAFVESAILYSSGLARLMDYVWVVDAPEEVRIARACRRDGASRESVARRIAAQAREIPAPLPMNLTVIWNDGTRTLQPQLSELLREL